MAQYQADSVIPILRCSSNNWMFEGIRIGDGTLGFLLSNFLLLALNKRPQFIFSVIEFRAYGARNLNTFTSTVAITKEECFEAQVYVYLPISK